MIRTSVLIIGAGPSGLISALCLAKLGVSCMLIERNDSVSIHPKAHELNARSIEILHQLDITDVELAEEAAPFTDGSRILFCNTINQEFGRIDLLASPERRAKYAEHLRSDSPYLNISQSALERILLDRVRQNSLITTFFNHQWNHLTQTDTTVICEVLNLLTDEIVKFESEFVIAADGAASRCRGFLNISMIGEDEIQEFASAYFENDLREIVRTPAKLYWIFHPHAPGTFIAHHIEKRWVYMTPIFPKYQSKETFNQEFFEHRIKEALGNLDVQIDVKSISFWKMSAQLAETYRKGRVLLVGDAAHRFPPTGGLGMNTGIADAHNVCWKLAAVLEGDANTDLLDTYEIERRPIAAQNTEESLFNYHKILEVPEAFGLDRTGLERLTQVLNTAPVKWLPQSWANKIEALAMNMVQKRLSKFHTDHDLRDSVLKSIEEQIPHFDRIGLDIGYIYNQGAIISDGSKPDLPADHVTQYNPTAMPGARLPHISLDADSGLVSLHDYIGYAQFTLFYGPAAQLLRQDMISGVESICIDELPVTALDKEKLHQLLGINNSGALLVRPDGHVAWRTRETSSGREINLQQIMNDLLHIQTVEI